MHGGSRIKDGDTIDDINNEVSGIIKTVILMVKIIVGPY